MLQTIGQQHSGRERDEQLFERIAVALLERGYAVLPASMPFDVADSLAAYLQLLRPDHFSPAAIGRGDEQIQNTFVRRDKILWIESEDQLSRIWLDWIGQMQLYLNRRLFMGLFSFESHFACYEPGDFYQKHKDAFRGQCNRVLSLVTYLNGDWAPDQGGELVIYSPDDDSELIKVTPNSGTLVLFLSEEFPHEVLVSKRSRFSVAGWFRVNTSTADRVDPPQ